MRYAWRALWRKEREQHRLAFALLFGVLAFLFLVQLAGLAASAQSLSQLEAVRQFLFPILVAAALFVGNRLIVQEYYGRTQLFVEALPIPLGALEAVKFVVGWLVLSTAGLGALGAGIALAAGSEPIGARFAGLLVLRVELFVTAIWSVSFTLGFLGRLRVPITLLAVGGLILVDRITAWEVQRFGPMALVDAQTFAFERERLDVGAVLVTLVLIVGALLVAFVLARLREGSAVEQLARPMSQREKSLASLLAVGVVASITLVAPDTEPEPYRFESDAIVADPRARIEVMYLDPAWHADAVGWLQRLRRARSWIDRVFVLPAPRPWVRLALDPGIPPDEEHTLRLDPQSGVVMAADYRKGRITDGNDLLGVLVHQVFSLHPHSRGTYEPKHWVLDGISRDLAEHSDPAARAPSASPAFQLGLIAASQVRALPTAFTAWDQTTERVGEPAASALAYVALQALERWQGRTSVERLARGVLERTAHGDVRDWWHDHAQPMAMIFEETTGLRYDVFLARFAGWSREQLGAARAQGLRWRGGSADVTVLPQGNALHVRARLEPPPQERLVCALRHAAIDIYDRPLSRGDLKREEYLWPAGAPAIDAVLSGHYGSGERVLLAFDCAGRDLPGTVRLGTVRLALP